MPFLETSAKKSTNVEEAFITMTAEIKEKNINKIGTTAGKGGSSFGQGKAMVKTADTPVEIDAVQLSK